MTAKPDRSVSPKLSQFVSLPWMLSLIWVALICFIAFWWHLGSTGLVDETEPLFAEAARQMTVTGDWVTPYFNEATRFDKPPLVYWLMAIAYQTIGVNEWAARFPSALAATVLTGLGFYTLRHYGRPRPGAPAARSLWLSAWIGSALIALNPQTIVWARTGVSDMLLSGCIGGALLTFFLGYAQPDRPIQTRWYWAFYVFLSLAVLTKGPVGLVLPGLIILLFLLYVGQLRIVWREIMPLRGLILFLALTLPWYILVFQANGEAYIDAFFGYHNFERFTHVVNNHSAPWFFYFLVVPVSFAPWSIHLPVAIARLRFWQIRYWQQQPRSSHLGLFALMWFVIVFAFFTIAVTKLPSYTIPLLPAAAILVGLFWSDQITQMQQSRGVQLSHIVNIALLVALAAALVYSPNWMGNDPELPDLPQLLQQSGVLVWGAGIWLVGAIASLILLLRRQGRWIWMVNLSAFLTFLIITLMPAIVLIDGQRQLPLRQLAKTITAQQPQEPIAMVGFGKPSLVFYTQRPITYIAELDQASARLRQLANRRQAKSILIVGRPRKLNQAGLKPEQYQVIEQAGVFQLVRLDVSTLKP